MGNPTLVFLVSVALMVVAVVVEHRLPRVTAAQVLSLMVLLVAMVVLQQTAQAVAVLAVAQLAQTPQVQRQLVPGALVLLQQSLTHR
jgi:hypothetical protein